MASAMTVNFAKAEEIRQHASDGPKHDSLKGFLTPEGKSLSQKQLRARVRRKMKRAQALSDVELEYLYKKPVEEWDLDELAHGRPRNENGNFRGPKPKWINAEILERAMEKYTAAIKTEMRATTVDAVGLLSELINNDSTDDRGKPIVPWSTKLDAAKFLLEHVVGKPTQRIESDVSVKLQGILGQVMVNPSDFQGPQSYELAHFPGITMPIGIDSDDTDLDARTE